MKSIFSPPRRAMPRAKEFDPDDVLEQAMELFWAQGYEATSAQDLVDRTGLNRSSLYNTFGCKERDFNNSGVCISPPFVMSSEAKRSRDIWVGRAFCQRKISPKA
jgi:hypothetical protein